ncbi:MAG: hypothetical protein AAF558_02815 [Verrucomicrobiota bacterium]
MSEEPQFDSAYADRIIPEPGHIIEVVDGLNEVKALTWVQDNLGYSMNGCFRVRDKQGKKRLVTQSRNSNVTPRWRTVD